MSEMADVFLLETSESFEKQEGVGMYMDITKAKFQELIDAVKARNKESENKLVWGLALVGGVVIVAIIAYAVYRFLTPDYYDDYDDDDFDDDFDDFDEEDFEEEDEGAEEAAEEAAPAEEVSDEDWREVERVDYSNMVDKLYASDDAKGVTHYTPYQISYEDYVDPTYEDYDREALTYYSDGILANIRDEIIKDHEEVVGDALEALMEEGVDTVYVRDDSNYIQYEIDRDVDAYVDVVGPIPDDDD